LHVASQFDRAIITLKHQLLVDTSFTFGPDMPFSNNYQAIEHIRIRGTRPELACKQWRLMRGISLKRDLCHLYLKRLLA